MTLRMILASVLAAIVAAGATSVGAVPAAGRQVAGPGATVTGTVTDEQGNAIAGLSVMLLPASIEDRRGALGVDRLKRAEVTGGAFEVSGVPAGAYRLTVADVAALDDWPAESLLAFLDGAAGLPVALAPGERVTVGVVVAAEPGVRRIVRASLGRLSSVPVRGTGAPGALPARGPSARGTTPPGTSSISGVLSADGAPVAGVIVAALMRRGDTYLSFGSATTDDGGAFSIGRLRAGEYVVGAFGPGTGSGAITGRAPVLVSPPQRAADGTLLSLATTYHPGVLHPTAAGVVVVANDHARAGVDFAMQRVPATAVDGRVAATGPAVTGRMIVLQPRDSVERAGGMASRIESVGVGGTFSFPAVPHGDYLLSVNAGPMGWHERTVRVGIDATSAIAVELRPPFTVRGRVEYAGSPAAPGPVTVTLRPAEMRTGSPLLRQEVAAEGTFTIQHVPGNRYILQATTERPWVQVSGLIGGEDTLDLPFDVLADRDDATVVLVNRESAVTVTVTTASGSAATSGSVVIFPTDRRMWGPASRRLSVNPISRDGRAVATSLPPGDYLAAWRTGPPTGAMPAGALAALVSQATAFTLGAGEQKAIFVAVKR